MCKIEYMRINCKIYHLTSCQNCKFVLWYWKTWWIVFFIQLWKFRVLSCVGRHTLGGQWRQTRQLLWQNFLKERFRNQMAWLLWIQSSLSWLWKTPNKLFNAVWFSHSLFISSYRKICPLSCSIAESSIVCVGFNDFGDVCCVLME